MSDVAKSPAVQRSDPGSMSGGARILALALCWLFIVFDGYDLIVFGTVVSGLGREWGLSKAQAGNLGSMAFFGMVFGALIAGWLTDLMGRKRVVLVSVLVFSVLTALCSLAPSPLVFGLLRFLAGLGLGGIVVSANALGADIATERMRPVVATLLMSGVPIGGCLAALIGIPVIPQFGWRAMFLPALFPVLIGVPLALKWLPDPRPAPRQADDEQSVKTGVHRVLARPWTAMSILFAGAVAATFIAWYGLGTWLPNLMETLGYNLGSALVFTLSLNLGAVAGSFITAWAGSRFGPVKAAAAAAVCAAVALIAMVAHPPQLLLYLLLAIAGVGTHGTACLATAAVGTNYPAHLRGSGLGWAFGIGRIGAVLAPAAAGWILAAGLGVDASFIFFAVMIALAALLFTGILRARPTATTDVQP